MKLHQNKDLFKQSVRFTAQEMNIPDIYIEKDYWVTYALHTIFADPIGKEVVFRGGTSLSKCFQLIDRFSEDIDLVVLRNEGETDSQLKNKIRSVSGIVSAVLPEILIEGVTNKKGKNRKTAHSYVKEFQGIYGQVRDSIILEASWLGFHEPFTKKPIRSYVSEMMHNAGMENLIEENDLLPFDVVVLDPKRTISEKIMSLVRFSYEDDPIETLKLKIRHCYDLHQLLQDKELSTFFDSNDFDKMLLRVGTDDIVSYKNNNHWLQHHPKDAKIFSDVNNVWDKLKSTYNGDFKKLVFGSFPQDEKVLATLERIKKRIAVVTWNLKVDANE